MKPWEGAPVSRAGPWVSLKTAVQETEAFCSRGDLSEGLLRNPRSSQFFIQIMVSVLFKNRCESRSRQNIVNSGFLCFHGISILGGNPSIKPYQRNN